MSHSRVGFPLLALLTALSGCCATIPAPQRRARAQDQRAVLNEGYSLLYSDIGNVARLDLIFLVKVEADTVEQVAREASDYATALKKVLEDAARDYPAVDLGLDPLPLMEERKREAVMKSSLLSLAPFVGLTGTSFERRALQSYEGALNHLQALCKVLAEEEPEPGLKRILIGAQSQLERHYASVLALLRERYYINTDERKVDD